MDDDLTPIRRQYLDIKRKYPHALLFFRLGDFYETFDSDAETASRELEIVLTSRNVAKGSRVPMAGIPYHAAEGYIARLIQRGYHVAICEQVGEAVGGLMPRQVTRVITPGTVMESGMLSPKKNNYLACGTARAKLGAVAYMDISTGEFRVCEFEADDASQAVRTELVRLGPAEVVEPEGEANGPEEAGARTVWPAWRFEPGRCEQALLRQFETASLEGFGLDRKSAAVCAAGVLVQYLQETQPAALDLVREIQTYSLADFMILDPATRRGLELTETLRTGEVQGSLLGVLDLTATAMGARALRRWILQPLLDLTEIRTRQSGVRAFFEAGLSRAAFRDSLRSLNDIERLVNRIGSGSALPRDLTALRESLKALPKVAEALAGLPPEAQTALPRPDPCADLLELLRRAVAEDPPATLAQCGVIRPGYSEELDRTVEGAREAREWIAGLEASEKSRTGIKTLKVGYNKVFGYYIEVSRGQAGAVPAEYIRKQTLVNAERFITPQMKEYETRVLHAEERIREIETRLFREVCAQIHARRSALLATAQAVARLDCLAALAEAAAKYDYVPPEVTDEAALDIRDGRHPVVERFLEAERFVPNDIRLEDGEIVRVITGPNMSGKSTYLRQVGLVCLMAQIGSFVPARSARIGLVDRIFTRIGARDEIHAGQSTFMVEMVETANILRHATRRSLLIFDEVGRGTSTYDGVSIAWAVIEFIHNHPRLQARTFFATHYHELIRLAGMLPGVRNYNVSVAEEGSRVVFLHKIVPGGADRSYGIHVAQLAGMPRPTIARAEEILKELEQGAGGGGSAAAPPRQLQLFADTDPLRIELKGLDLASMTPLEALGKLFEWQKNYPPEK
ncbi:MAG: DNA mismatch repair protein MutS [Anaerolineales bacterium]|nr:DNA mismatch repair protein MutS [Anaerolineales bacterium]